MDSVRTELPAPLGLLAELTHRCPLGCPYCSNPLALDAPKDELDTRTWSRVFREAAALGIPQVHLSGGEPVSRRDLADIVSAAHSADLYTNLITSGIGLTDERLRRLADNGIDHVQLSFQDTSPASSDHIAGYPGSFARKANVATAIVRLGLPLTVNIVVHRANIERVVEMVEFAIMLGALRVEIAHVQYYGWALKNRSVLMPSREQAVRAIEAVGALRETHRGRIVIDSALPDYYARYPKPCMGGWGRRSLNVTPSGKVLPCHAAELIPNLEFWSVTAHSLGDIWRHSPAFNAFRGTAWMMEPCRSCPKRHEDFGGCRCQAFLLTGNPNATDPVCHLSPSHDQITRATRSVADEYTYRHASRRVRADTD